MIKSLHFLFGYLIVLLIAPYQIQAQSLEDAIFLSTTPVSLLSGFSPDVKYEVKTYKIRYFTTDIDGTQTIASGALVIPSTNACDSFPLTVYHHGTVLEKENVPSRDNFEAIVAKVLASAGAVAVAPDYLGLGDNPGLHPYLHAQSEATATIDLMRASREFIRDSLNQALNGEVYITGYSQGGHAAMATVKYTQDNNLLSEFNLIGAGPASGPYNLSSTMLPLLLSNLPYSNPGYVTYLLFAMQRVYGNIYQSYSDILDSPYDTIVPPLFDGTYNMTAVNAVLPNKVRDFIQDSVLDNLIADSLTMRHPIRLALMANDNYDWNPAFPMELYYCTQDEQVDYQNALDAEAAMQANGANVIAVNKGAFNHGGCFIPSLQGALDHFKLLSTSCSPVSLSEHQAQLLEVYPQPASHHVRIKGAEGKRVLAYSSKGRLLFDGKLNEFGDLNMSSWSRGVYLIVVENFLPIKIHKN